MELVNLPLKPIDSETLGRVIIRILEQLSYLRITRSPGAPTVELPYCFHAELHGGKEWLVLRSSAAFAKRLVLASHWESETSEVGVLKRLCHLASMHLATDAHALQTWPFSVAKEGLPAGLPRALVWLEVDGQALEVSYWSVRKA